MSKKYEERQPTGREYVDSTKEFCSMTIFYCMKLPEKWMDVLLMPMIHSAQEIESLVVRANKIYINEKMPPEELTKAYRERMAMLQEAIREFTAFDTSFERLMAQVDISGAEKRRLKNIVLGIIKEAQEQQPDLKDITIRVVAKDSDMEYMSASGVKRYQLKLTSRNRDHWLDLEAKSLQHIRNRIDGDKKAVSRLAKAC